MNEFIMLTMMRLPIFYNCAHKLTAHCFYFSWWYGNENWLSCISSELTLYLSATTQPCCKIAHNSWEINERYEQFVAWEDERKTKNIFAFHWTRICGSLQYAATLFVILAMLQRQSPISMNRIGNQMIQFNFNFNVNLVWEA